MANDHGQSPNASLPATLGLSCDRAFNLNFRYPQIQPHTNIRVLQLSRRDPLTKVIYCKFKVCEDIKSSEHVALSYTWGPDPMDNSQLRFIDIDGQPFAIRKNLHHFLQTLYKCSKRQSPGHDWLSQFWFIDAICINQADLFERSQQVRLMRDVYATAREVILWTPVRNHRAMFGFDRFYKRFDHRFNHGTRVSPSQWSGDERAIFKRLFEHEFWDRMWIVQEVLLATQLTMFVGAYPFALDEFILVNFPLGSSKYDLDWGRASHVISEWSSFEINRTDHGGIPIDQALRSFGKQKCAINKDKIYGLLGLLNPLDPNISKINPDYNKTDVDVFEDAFPALLATVDRLEHDPRSFENHAHGLFKFLGSVLGIPEERIPEFPLQLVRDLYRSFFNTQA